MTAAERANNRRKRWSREARRELRTILAAPPLGPGAARALAVLKLCESVAVPEGWAEQAAMVAFLLPHYSERLADMAAMEDHLSTPSHVGLVAAAEWLVAKQAPQAQDFVRALQGLLDETARLYKAAYGPR